MSGDFDDQIISNLFPDTPRVSPSNSTDRVVVSTGGYGNYPDGLRVEISELELRRNSLEEEVMWLERQRDRTSRRGGRKLASLEHLQFFANKTYAKAERARYYFDPDASDDENYDATPASPSSKQSTSTSMQPALQLMELKENIVRVKKGFRPISVAVNTVAELSSWKNPISSFTCMCFYFYLVYTRRLTLFCTVLTLGFFVVTYLDKLGFHFVTIFDEPETEEEKRSDLKDLWKGAKQALLRVQLLAGDTADTLEKFSNFCQWEDREGANRLLTALAAMVSMLLFFPSGVAQQVALSYMGYQIFVENPLFKKFPRLKRRFSFVRKVWKRLPNHAAKSRRQKTSATTPYKIHDIPTYSSFPPPPGPSGNHLTINAPRRVRKISTESVASLNLNSDTPASGPASKTDHHLRALLDFYNIDESPLPSLKGGIICSHRCKRSLFSLAGEIGGRLYATHNHLIFSPNFRKRDGFVLNMNAVRSVEIGAGKVEKFGLLKHSIDLATEDESFYLTIWTLRSKEKQKTNELLQWIRSKSPEEVTSSPLALIDGEGVIQSSSTVIRRPRISYNASTANQSASEDENETTVFLTSYT